MSLKIKQESTYTGSDWWTWSLWLDGPAEELNQVDHVVYTLHPTFPSPVHRVADRESSFRLESAGWGEFEIYIDICLKNGRTRKRRHWLRLRYPERKDAVAKRGAPTPEFPARMPGGFLSYGVADVQIARVVRAVLVDRGLEILVTDDMIAAEIPFEQQVGDLIRRADAAIFIISGRPSLWVTKEIDMAMDRKISHIVPLLVGEGARLPVRLKEFPAVRIENPGEARTSLENIATMMLAIKRA
jgi:hypothetical protein